MLSLILALSLWRSEYFNKRESIAMRYDIPTLYFEYTRYNSGTVYESYTFESHEYLVRMISCTEYRSAILIHTRIQLFCWNGIPGYSSTLISPCCALSEAYDLFQLLSALSSVFICFPPEVIFRCSYWSLFCDHRLRCSDDNKNSTAISGTRVSGINCLEVR